MGERLGPAEDARARKVGRRGRFAGGQGPPTGLRKKCAARDTIWGVEAEEKGNSRHRKGVPKPEQWGRTFDGKG